MYLAEVRVTAEDVARLGVILQGIRMYRETGGRGLEPRAR